MNRERMTIVTRRRVLLRAVVPFLAASAGLLSASAARAQDAYQEPPEAVRKVLHAPLTPRASVGRARDTVLLYGPVLYPPIAQLALPFLRLAGLRIDVATNGPHNAPRFNNLVLKRVADGQEQKVDLPARFYVSQPFWSPESHTA